MYKILITGSNGLLGRHLIRQFADKYQIWTTSYTAPEERLEGVHYIDLDLSHEWESDRLLPKQMDIVIHLAQSSKYKDFPEQALDIFSVNTDSTARLLDYAARSKVKQFIYYSTGGLYKGQKDALITENSDLIDLDSFNYHFASKFCSEVLCKNYQNMMKMVIVRPFFIYGGGQRRSMLIPRLIDQIKKGESIKVEGACGVTVNPIHVSDACFFVSKLIEQQVTGLFNMAGPEKLSLKEICEKIGEALGVRPNIIPSDGEPTDLVASTDKMVALGATPKVTFSTGLKDCLND